MQDSRPEQGALFEQKPPARYESELEKSVRESIEAIDAEHGIKPSKMFLKQTALELARSIDKGNAKGRAVANESAQLVATLALLEPEEVADVSNLPPELKALMDAFATKPAVPGPGGTAAIHAA